MTAIQRTRTARRDQDKTSVVVWLHGWLLDGRSDGDLHYEGGRRGDRQHA
jgi:hypothetical protein